jgi:hypothetical protein
VPKVFATLACFPFAISLPQPLVFVKKEECANENSNGRENPAKCVAIAVAIVEQHNRCSLQKEDCAL